jgi:hypothetical protein
MGMPLVDAGNAGPHMAVGLRGKLVLGKPANALAVTPSASPIYMDPATSEPVPVLIYVGVAGNVTVQPYGLNGSNSVTFTGVPAGTLLPVAVIAVTALAGGAADLIAIW